MKLRNAFHALTTSLLLQLPLNLGAQPAPAPADFPELNITPIAGAPGLSQPMRITGTKKEVVSEGMGLAAPAFYDWDGDGLKDLLIGEFGSGIEHGRSVGNFVRVYKNTGTETNPEFTGIYDYARPPFEILTNGTPYSVDQYCCIGFTPQFIDLNNDGQLDMITGQYYGEVTWFAGSKKGFTTGVALPQVSPKEGDPRNGETRRKAHQYYWIYSSASLGDFTGDGKPDLITGGRTLRISKNIGTDTAPQFGPREVLLDMNGKPLKIYEYNTQDLKFYEDRKVLGYEPPPAGDEELSPYVVDWDNDGTLDILATNTYMHKGLSTVDFFKGVSAPSGITFQPPVPLFTVKDGQHFAKAFPGMGPRVTATDWNNDGIKDLLIGTSIVTLTDKFNAPLSWQWQDDNKILPAGKNAAVALSFNDLSPAQIENYKQSIKLPEGVTLEQYLTLHHQGYIYVMLGRKEEPAPVKAKTKKDSKHGKK